MSLGFAEVSQCFFFYVRALSESCLLRCVSVCLVDMPVCVSSGACQLTSEFEQGGAGK